jgi:hypothetical protein
VWIGIVAGVLIVGGGGAAGALMIVGGGPTSRAVSGSFELTDDATAGNGCVGTGVDASVGPGTTVTLSGPGGRKLATAKLSAGSSNAGVCSYSFAFPNIKTNLASYTAAVAGQPATTLTRQALQSAGWQFSLRYGPPTVAVTGSLELDDVDTALAECVGQGGYSDIDAGATVIVTDQSGRILGSGALDPGTASGGECTYTFSIPGVRQDEQRYAVEVTHRGKVVSSATQMESNNWNFQLSLG